MLPTDECIDPVIGFLSDGEWHYEQDLKRQLAQATGADQQDAFNAVIRVWNRIKDRVDRRLNTELLDFEWRLKADV